MVRSYKKADAIAILGYGLEGQSTYNFLIRNGVDASKITLLDKNKECIVPEGARSILGGHYVNNLASYDLIFTAPGMTKTLLQQQYDGPIDGLPLTSQTELFFTLYKGKTIGITGTKGKTTLCVLLHTALRHAGVDVLLAGNGGQPVLDHIDFDNPPEIVVYELSSYMLEAIQASGYRLDIGLFNTFYHTHEKEHGSIENYRAAKLSMLNHASQSLIGSQVVDTIPRAQLPKEFLEYGKRGEYKYNNTHIQAGGINLLDHTSTKLLGEHNTYNICGVAGVCDLLEKQGMKGMLDALQEVLPTFSAIEHRIEPVGMYHGIERYNDAIATTPQATCAAIESFKEKVGALFYGGIEGPYDHQLVIDLIKKYSITTLVLFPDTGHHIIDALADDETYTILETKSIKEGVLFVAKHTAPGSVALLSCGSPSFSCRSGFIEKGTRFKEAVISLT